jgi:RNA-directed DNA polymerase
VRAALAARREACRLARHPEKTPVVSGKQVVSGKDDERRGTYPHETCEVLGYTFRPRRSKTWPGQCCLHFSPAVSEQAGQRMRAEIRRWKRHLRRDKTLADLSRMCTPKLRGWLQSYGPSYRSALSPILRPLDRALARWASRKYPQLRGHVRRATHGSTRISRRDPGRLAHGQMGVRRGPMTGAV